MTATILVVDDNEGNRTLAGYSLEDEGYRVVLASSGAEAIAQFAAEVPDCVLLDIRMPGLDGFATCERIRALPGGLEAPIVFLTALRDIHTFERAIRAGADDFVTKPVCPKELASRVQTALTLRRCRTSHQGPYELLKHQRDALVRLQLQKERLAALLVHDLKNPVNSLDALAQLLLRGGRLSDADRQSVRQMRFEANQLASMISNLLDISKAEEGGLAVKREVVDLSALCTNVVSELELAAKARNVKLDAVPFAKQVLADPELLRRVVANLVDNAIRHAPPGTTVTILTTPRAGTTELCVADEGSGIPVELRQKVFEAFAQFEGADRRGSGLGLTFCKLAVEAHGGRLWITEGTPGSIFCVSLPNEA